MQRITSIFRTIELTEMEAERTGTKGTAKDPTESADSRFVVLRPSVRSATPEYWTHRWAVIRKYNYNGVCAYANGFPALAAGLDVVILRFLAAKAEGFDQMAWTPEGLGRASWRHSRQQLVAYVGRLKGILADRNFKMWKRKWDLHRLNESSLYSQIKGAHKWAPRKIRDLATCVPFPVVSARCAKGRQALYCWGPWKWKHRYVPKHRQLRNKNTLLQLPSTLKVDEHDVTEKDTLSTTCTTRANRHWQTAVIETGRATCQKVFVLLPVSAYINSFLCTTDVQ